MRDVALDLSSVPMTLEGGTFDPTALGVTATSGSMDYAGTCILGWLTGRGRGALLGDDVPNNTRLNGSLTSSDSLETLVIPINVTLRVEIDSPLPNYHEWFTLTLRGSVVATRTLPEDVSRPIPDDPDP